VEVDEDHLARVIDDLVNNALTYTIRTPRLVIGLTTRSRRAIVRVGDNGVGIRAGERERVFDRLYRVVDPQVVVPGIGLGLYICRQLAQSYGGSLVVESSTPGKGTFSPDPTSPHHVGWPAAAGGGGGLKPQRRRRYEAPPAEAGSFPGEGGCQTICIPEGETTRQGPPKPLTDPRRRARFLVRDE
jgi:hypothetical protein